MNSLVFLKLAVYSFEFNLLLFLNHWYLLFFVLTKINEKWRT